MPLWLTILLSSLIILAIAFSRYGLGWLLAESTALAALWLSALSGRMRPWTWSRRHFVWAFVYCVFVMTTFLFPLVALFAGQLISPWWCLTVSLGIGVLLAFVIWPAPLRYWQSQRPSN